jgi:diguanylate cyclase (GGDEF)-like protein
MFHKRLIRKWNYVPYIFALLMGVSLLGSFGIVLYYPLLPPLHIEGVGPAPYRVSFEYINALVMLLTGLYVSKRGFFNKKASLYLFTAFYMLALYSVCLALYKHFFDFLIVLGSFYRFLSYLLFAFAVLYFELRDTALSVLANSHRLIGALARQTPQKKEEVWFIKVDFKGPVEGFYLFDVKMGKLVASADDEGKAPDLDLAKKHKLVKSFGGQLFEGRWYYLVHDKYLAVLKLAYEPQNPIEKLHVQNVCRLLVGYFLNTLYFDELVEERSKELNRLYLLLETSEYAVQAYNNIETFSKQVLERLDYVLSMDGSLFYIWNKNAQIPEKLVFSSSFISKLSNIRTGELIMDNIEEEKPYGLRKGYIYSKFETEAYQSGVIGFRREGSFTEEELLFLRTVSNQFFHVIKLMKVIEDLEKAQARVRLLSEYDPLTMLYNRKSLEKLIEEEITRASRFNEHFCALLIDIDNFKVINTAYGHHVGDFVLKRVAELLKGSTRHADKLGRLGGDEFLLLLPRANKDTALAVAERLKEKIETTKLEVDGKEIFLSVSVGVVCYPSDAKAMHEVIATAEALVSMAKREGKGKVKAVDETTTSFIVALRETEERVVESIERKNIEVFLQEIVDVRTGKIFGFEALMRLRVNSDFLPPARFLSLAEDMGFLPKLDLAMVEKTIMYVKHTDADFFVCLNLSPTGISDVFIERVSRLVQDGGFSPERIVFEITERRAVEDMGETIRLINLLRGFGFRFAIDDFGSGYSSMYYLKYLPVDFVKIEGEFVKGAKTSQLDRVFIKNVVELANILNINTIAEFVEDQETLEILKELGVDYAQCYHLGKPEPAQEKLRNLFSKGKNQAPEEEG